MIPVPPWRDEEIATLLSYWVVGMPEEDKHRLAQLSEGRPREVMRLARMYCDLLTGKVPFELRSTLGAAELVADDDAGIEVRRARCVRLLERYEQNQSVA